MFKRKKISPERADEIEVKDFLDMILPGGAVQQ